MFHKFRERGRVHSACTRRAKQTRLKQTTNAPRRPQAPRTQNSARRRAGICIISHIQAGNFASAINAFFIKLSH